jgi:hypothetical protein
MLMCSSHDRHRVKAAVIAGEAQVGTMEKRQGAEAAASVCIQTIVRRFLARATARHHRLIRRYKAKKAAAVVLQARARRLVYRRRYLVCLASLLKMQALMRGALVRKRIRDANERKMREKKEADARARALFDMAMRGR